MNLVIKLDCKQQVRVVRGKKIVLTALLLLFPLSMLHALDFSLSPGVFAFFPAGKGSLTAGGFQRYDIGGGGNVSFELDITNIISNPFGLGYAAGVEAGMLFSPKEYNDGQINFYSFGALLSLSYFPLSRLPVRLESGLGIYSANDGEEKAPSNFWYRVGVETGFRFTPGISLTASGGWRQFRGESRPLASGVYVGLGVRFNFELGEQTSSGGASVFLSQYDAVYPVLTPLYQQFPVGSIIVRNNENAEIRDVRLFFRAGNYTSSEFPCGQIAIIQKGREIEFPLYADFSPEILRFADSGRILGELVVRYTFLGREREVVRTINIAVHNRNIPVPGDYEALAAFISPTSPEVLQFARYAAALARTNRRMGLNTNMKTSMWMFEAVRANIVNNNKIIDTEVQFPSQTLAYGSGSVLDIALLYAASLQAAGISAALIIFPDGEIICAATLGIFQNDAATQALFDGPDKLLILDGEVWIPAAMSYFESGFTASWQEAIRRIDGLIGSGESAQMIIIEEAWGTYPPAPFPLLGVRFALPEETGLTAAANTAIQNYIDSEFEPKIAAVRAQLSNNPNAALFNQLANLYLRSGMINQANQYYEIAAGMGLIGAMVNLGNVALNENDLTRAEYWFRQALFIEPENRNARRGMEFVEARR